jgi:8-oxo-dGTP diphosphatase
VKQVEAAGGVVVRRTDAGGHEAVLVHRPQYDDWTLPKGKLESAESRLEAAVREVCEETGLRVLVGPELGTTRYADSRGRDKTVFYWAMAPAGDEPAPTKEVDEARWVSFDDAPGMLSYERDREVLERAATLVADPAPRIVCLVRHGQAGDSSQWDAPDELRPLSEHGSEQAQALVPLLAAHRPVLLVSSPYRRCVQTLEPLGEKLGLPVQAHDALADDAHADDALRLLRAIAELGPAVACTHGELETDVIESLAASCVPLTEPLRYEKGSTWELAVEAGRIVSGRYVEPPA